MKVLAGQSLIDIAIQELGSAEGAYNLAVLNGMSITDDLVPGQELVMPDVVNKNISTYYANKSLTPATVYNVQINEVPRVFFEELPIEFM
jgi:hypothetical protein